MTVGELIVELSKYSLDALVTAEGLSIHHVTPQSDVNAVAIDLTRKPPPPPRTDLPRGS